MSTRSARSTSSSLSPAPSLSQPPTHNPPKVTTSSQPTFGSSWTTTTLSLQGTAAAALKSKINLLLHDSKSEFDWNAILLAIAPQPGPIHEVVSFGQVPNVRILTNEDLLALSVEGETRSRLHDGIQQALAEAKAAEVAASSSRRDPPARRSASSSTRSTPPRLSASSSTPSTPARTLHVGPRTGMRFPDLSLRVQTFVRILNARMLFEASGVEGEVKVYKHGPIRKPCALPEHGDDEDRQVPADAINHSLHDQWLRGLSKAVVYLTIAFEIAGTRLGLSVVSELLQRLAVVADVGEERTAVAIEVGTVPEEQPGTFAAFLRTSAGQEHNFPWRFGYVNFEAPGGPVVELDWAGIEAYRDVFNAGFAMFRDVRVDAPIQRFSDLAVDASPLVNNILSRCAEFQTWEELRRLEVSAFARPQLEPHYRAAAEKAGESIPDDVFHRPKGSRAPSSAFTRRSSTGSAPRSSPSSPSAARRRRSVPVTPPRQPVFRSPKPSPGGGGGGVGAGSGYRRSPRFSTSGGAGGGGGVGAANGGGEEGKSGGTAGAGDCDNGERILKFCADSTATLRFACPRSFSTTLEEDGGEVSFVSSVSSTTRSADAPSLEEDGPDSFWEEHIVSDEDENWDGDDWVKDSDDSDTESDPGRAARSAIDKFLDALTLEQLIHLFERIPPIPIVLVPREEMGEVIHGTAGW